MTRALRVSPGGCAATLDFPASRPRQAEAACVIAPAARARIGLPHPQRARTQMALIPGNRLEHYDILGIVGAGGMGQVHRARDLKLNRDVAIKVLNPSVAADADRLARFSREAQVLAALNHPNIAQIHGIVEAPAEAPGGVPVPALVMEFVEGPTLADRLAHGPMSPDEALPIARQIADALEAAHEYGIIHRDLKPANIMVRDDGIVKVLDFGLAKALDSAASDAEVAQSPTISIRATQQGMVLGTAAYMAPEQARGKRVDLRADVWAFGCVLYEMLAGRRAFDAADVTDTIVAVLSKEPDWQMLPASAAAVRPLLSRCLRKDVKQRLQAIGDARIQIEELIAGPEDQPAGHRAPAPARTAWALAAAAIAGAVVAGGVMTWSLGRAAPGPAFIARLEILPPPSQALAVQTADRNLAVSPDGRHVVYRSGNPSQLVLRPIDRREGQVIAGTSGARYPFFSPDGRWIAFFDGLMLKRVAVAGGPVLTICESEIPRGASWGDDGHIVFATRRQMLRVAADGGEPVELTKPDPVSGEQGVGISRYCPEVAACCSPSFRVIPLPRHTSRSSIARAARSRDLFPAAIPSTSRPGISCSPQPAACGRYGSIQRNWMWWVTRRPSWKGFAPGTLVPRTMRYRTRAPWSTSLNRQLPGLKR